jgi:hypothetical protein
VPIMLRRMNRPFPVGSESKVASRSLSLLPKAAACCRTYPTAYPWAQLNDQECQRVIRIVAVLRQERSTQVALHGNELKWWLALMILQPTCPAAAEIARPSKTTIRFSTSQTFLSALWRPEVLKARRNAAGE